MTVAVTPPPAPNLQYAGRLLPRGEKLHAVRWLRTDGRDVRQRFFRRRCDAEKYAERLMTYGKQPRVFETTTSWRECQ